MKEAEIRGFIDYIVAQGRDMLVPRRFKRPAHEIKRDAFRGWCGARKSKIVIGETHSEKARRQTMAALERQIAFERAAKTGAA